MGKDRSIGRRISVHPSLIVWLSILLYLQPRLSVAFLLAAAFHELGHVLALSLMGKPPDCLSLSFLGANMDVPALSYGGAAIAYAAGPLFSFLLGLYGPCLPTLGRISIGLGLFNLLPISGLDGSGILTCLLCLALSPDTAQCIARWVSLAVSLLAFPLILYWHHVHQFSLWLPVLAGLLLVKSVYLLANTS